METEDRKVAYGQMFQPIEEGVWKQVPGAGGGHWMPQQDGRRGRRLVEGWRLDLGCCRKSWRSEGAGFP